MNFLLIVDGSFFSAQIWKLEQKIHRYISQIGKKALPDSMSGVPRSMFGLSSIWTMIVFEAVVDMMCTLITNFSWYRPMLILIHRHIIIVEINSIYYYGILGNVYIYIYIYNYTCVYIYTYYICIYINITIITWKKKTNMGSSKPSKIGLYVFTQLTRWHFLPLAHLSRCTLPPGRFRQSTPGRVWASDFWYQLIHGSIPSGYVKIAK